MYVAIFSSIFVVFFALFILFYLNINYKVSEYVKQFEESNKIILNKLEDINNDVDTMDVKLMGEIMMLKNKMNSHNSGHVNSEKVKKDIKQWNDSKKENENTIKTINSKIDSMGMLINDFDEELDTLETSFARVDALDTLRKEIDGLQDKPQESEYDLGELERVGTVLEEIVDRIDRYDNKFDSINRELSKM